MSDERLSSSYYAIVNKISGNVEQLMSWGDGRVFPSDWELTPTEEVVTLIENQGVEVDDVYNSVANEFYILDISDNELEIEDIKFQLSEIELVLSEFQEETWKALSIDETKLSQVWQDRLLHKRTLKSRLLEIS